jgi:hypothetical protein
MCTDSSVWWIWIRITGAKMLWIRIRLRIGILATTIPLVPYFLGKAKNLNNLSVTVVEAMVVLLVVEVALQLWQTSLCLNDAELSQHKIQMDACGETHMIQVRTVFDYFCFYSGHFESSKTQHKSDQFFENWKMWSILRRQQWGRRPGLWPGRSSRDFEA